MPSYPPAFLRVIRPESRARQVNAYCSHPACGVKLCEVVRASDEYVWFVEYGEGYVRRPDGVVALSRHAAHSRRHTKRNPSRYQSPDGSRSIDGASWSQFAPDGRLIWRHVNDSPRARLMWVGELGELDHELEAGKPVIIACSQHGHYSTVSLEAVEEKYLEETSALTATNAVD